MLQSITSPFAGGIQLGSFVLLPFILAALLCIVLCVIGRVDCIYAPIGKFIVVNKMQ